MRVLSLAARALFGRWQDAGRNALPPQRCASSEDHAPPGAGAGCTARARHLDRHRRGRARKPGGGGVPQEAGAPDPRGHVGGPSRNLRPGSDPSVLPGPVLIADRDNNRLLEVSPQGRGAVALPEPRRPCSGADVHAARRRLLLSRRASRSSATQEDDFAISVIDLANGPHRLPLRPSGRARLRTGYVHNPDDAMLSPSGELITADIKNCRVLVIRPPAHAAAAPVGGDRRLRTRSRRRLRQPERGVPDG